MIKLLWREPTGLIDVHAAVQTAIDLEFSTLAPYLYAQFSLRPGSNEAANELLESIVLEEMTHMCLACNILNAIGGTVELNVPHYPGPLPGDVGGDLIVHLLPFSPAAIQQGMAIEAPSEAIDPPVAGTFATDNVVTIGEYYLRLDATLGALPAAAWVAGRNQVSDSQFFAGQLFAVNSYADAHRAITNIVSEGEGTPVSPETTGSPLDFENDLAHYYRFWAVARNQQLAKANNKVGYAWSGPLGVDWNACYPAIPDPQDHDFSQDSPAAQAAQVACNEAYTAMVDALTTTFQNTSPAGLGAAVRAMFDLRLATFAALDTPLADGTSVAGPAFLYLGGTP